MMTPLPEVLLARLFAVLAGGVVITSLGAELPDDREGRFWPFCLGPWPSPPCLSSRPELAVTSQRSMVTQRPASSAQPT